ncbi:uncharacterized protein VTP21DRAFT_3024 [Calcarisporiella thermophila]|uniref:uncharacterized protein n=1 Tax=Calcarisporiella thermophila TaxID=911321 RepID=UPI0037421718
MLEDAVGFILVALCWGFTNPFIKRGSDGLERVRQEGGGILTEWSFLLRRWQYVLPLLINLSGSFVYYYTLGKADLSLAVPISNSLTFIFTTLGGILLGENIGGRNTWIGMSLVVAGVALCVNSKI